MEERHGLGKCTHWAMLLMKHRLLRLKNTFDSKGVKAAATRARKALGELGKLAKSRRAEIQDQKNNL